MNRSTQICIFPNHNPIITIFNPKMCIGNPSARIYFNNIIISFNKEHRIAYKTTIFQNDFIPCSMASEFTSLQNFAIIIYLNPPPNFIKIIER